MSLQEELKQASNSMTDLKHHNEETMKTKENEIIGLKTEVVALSNELKKLKTNDNVSKHT